jgi:hypothetical protein
LDGWLVTVKNQGYWATLLANFVQNTAADPGTAVIFPEILVAEPLYQNEGAETDAKS